ncbi:MAG: hypothetical protein OHK0046_10330 [Anaerolineae bacterium]
MHKHLAWLALCASFFTHMDTGCGSGTQTAFLAQHFPTVIGMDVSPAALDIAERSNGGTVFWMG